MHTQSVLQMYNCECLFHGLISKLANTRINKFMNAKIERDLKVEGKVVDGNEVLRPRLKAYALATKCQWCVAETYVHKL